MKTPSAKPPSLTDIATALEVSVRRVSQLRLEGMPIHSVEAATAWRDKARAAKDGDSSERLRLARIKLVDSQRQKVDIENKVRSGELVEIGTVFADAVAVTTATKTALLGLLQDLPPKLEGLTAIQIFPILRERFHACLENLSTGTFTAIPEVKAVIGSFKTVSKP